MSLRAFPSFDETNAPAAAREPLTRAKRAFGGIPAPLGRYAGSPRMMLAALGGLETFEQGTLAPVEREVVAMTMGRHHGCQFCLKHHSRLLRSQRAPEPLLEALEQGTPLPSARLEALRSFVLASLHHHADVPNDVWLSFREAGYTHEQALEVMLGISVYTLTTLTNRLTETSE